MYSSALNYFDMTAKPTALKWFECPHCGKQTSHQVPSDLRLTWAQCESCGKDFVIENDKASKPSR